MQQLLKKLQSIRQEKIDAFKRSLAEKEAEELAGLSAQVEQLTADIERVAKTAKTQAQSKEAYESEITTRFALDSYKQELLSLFWQDIVDQHFGKKDTQESWIGQQIDELAVDISSDTHFESGVIEAGKSYDHIKKASLPKGVTVKKSEKGSPLAEEPGFILTTNSRVVDARLSTYLQELFKRNRSSLYQVAFE